MSHPNALFVCRLAGVVAGAMLCAADARAELANGFPDWTNQIPALAVTVQPGEIVGNEQVFRGILRSGTNEFVFVQPEGLRTKTSPEGTIVLISGDMSYYVSIRLIGPPLDGPGLKAALRERIASQYPRASSLEESAVTVAERKGTELQLRQEVASVGSRLVRILWVPFNAGVVEFVLNADADHPSAGQGAFDTILLTFRSNERGRAEIITRSDRT